MQEDLGCQVDDKRIDEKCVIDSAPERMNTALTDQFPLKEEETDTSGLQIEGNSLS